MNNKGFAITTLIYGLAIMMLLLIAIIMATLTSMRKNMKDLSDQIEEELLTLSNGTVEYTDYSPNYIDYYTVPQGGTGFYRIEVWSPANDFGQYGYYASGIIKLQENQQLLIYRGPYAYYRTSYVSALRKFSNFIYSHDNPGTSNERQQILYTDQTRGWLIGSPTSDARIFNTDDGFFDYFRNNNYTTEFFTDTLVVPNVNPTAEFGKVIIRRISPNTLYGYDKPYNQRYWVNSEGIRVRVTEDKTKEGDTYAKDCRVYYTYDYRTKCFMIGENESNDSEQCTSTKYDSKIDAYTLRDIYNESHKVNYDYQEIRLVCPNNKNYSNLNFRIMLSSDKANAQDEKTYSTIIYDGKYRDNNGMGISLSQYQPDSIVDKPDHGNYYIMDANNNKKVLTVKGDGKSVGMELLGAKDTQRWAIDRVCNYNLIEHKCVNSNPNGTTIDKVYRIVELTTYNAMDIELDENIEGNNISAQYNYNSLSINEPQLWRLIPNRDGTYSFKTVVNPLDNNPNMGYIMYDENGILKLNKRIDNVDFENQKFRLFSYDYSVRND